MNLQIPLSPEILKSVARIDHCRGVWAAGTTVPPDRLARLREDSRIHSVASSCRMSGVRVTEAEVMSLLRGEACAFREGAEVVGYAEAMDRPFPSETPIVTTDEIRRLHGVMLGKSSNPPEASPWRAEALHLEAFDAEGKAIGRVFQTLPPRMIPEKLEELATWLELELREGKNHPILVIATSMLAFLAISPFQRGNGRLGRLLTVHLLRRAGYSHVAYSSLEQIMEEMRERYHDAFDAAETRLWTADADISPWIDFFLAVLDEHCERVGSKIGLERRALAFSPLQRAIVDTVREHGTARAALLMASTGANRNTLKDNLRKLVDQGVLERLGEKRGSIYRLATGEGTSQRGAAARRGRHPQPTLSEA